ncbi:hypothetical protein FDP41_000509 [Naegleria fowleri]|uniref:DNA primase n=1 Tax=Naegleria fowleri TaxID=5763 RepID=A0A6A5CGC2_NAEFO|nr:uncharacterized protein FDP41_000509 [Naegleria fowleri]KAF0984610.1 hypothetical protein FDP41_000509 [Naegleria fowleri]CAG4716382.1 unnamed protein product [Naegleria fowleri]
MAITNEQLKQYYEKYFPFGLLAQWLHPGDEKQIINREFSYSFKVVNPKTQQSEVIFSRYKCVKNGDDLKEQVVKYPNPPVKLDIGPVYNMAVSKKNQVSNAVLIPVEKEYCIDIDISDYDDVRFCGCRGGKYCEKCWRLMNCAMEVLDHLLVDVFGTKHLIWVYSGRRGIHCWASDELLKKLNNEGRSAISRFIHIYQNNSVVGEKQSKRVNLSGTAHPTFDIDSEVFTICERYFMDVFVNGMGIFDDEETMQTSIPYILNLIYNNDAKNIIQEILKSGKNGDTVYTELREAFLRDKKNKHFLWEIVYSFVYPRLDVNVSKGFNHLLKSPYCVHPDTGNICVPIRRHHYQFYPDVHGVSLHNLLSNTDNGKFNESLKILKEHVQALVKAKNSASMDTLDF